MKEIFTVKQTLLDNPENFKQQYKENEFTYEIFREYFSH